MIYKSSCFFLLFALITSSLMHPLIAGEKPRYYKQRRNYDQEDEQQEARRHKKRDRARRSHVHRWKKHKTKGDGDQEWRKKWHGKHGYHQHASHMWHKYGWFWDDATKSWYQCTPIDDPEKGYGCEYKGKWYKMVKEDPETAAREEDEDEVEEAVVVVEE